MRDRPRTDHKSAIAHYFWAVLTTAVALGLRLLLDPVLGFAIPYATFFVAVAISAILGGWIPGVLSAVLGGFAALYFILPPRHEPSLIYGAENQLGFLLYLIVCSILIALAGVQRRTKLRAAHQAAEQQAIMDAAPAAIFIAHDSECRSVSGNRTAYTLLRQPPGSNLSKSTPGGERSATLRAVRDGVEIPLSELPLQKVVSTGQPVRNWEEQVVFDDGTSIELLGNVEPLLDEQRRPQGAVAVLNEITERKKEELELRKFLSLANNSVEFISMCDLQLLPFYANPAALRLVGLDSLEQARRIPVSEFFFPEDRDFVTEEFFPRVVREGRAEVEIRFRHFKTGKPVWMIYNVFQINDAADQPVAFATVSRDITERKQIEDMLRQSEATTRALLDNAAQAILAIDTSGSIVMANRMATEMFGFKMDELLGKPIEMLMPNRMRADHAEYRGEFVSRPRERSMGSGLELVGLRKDGSEFPVDISLSTVSTAKGVLAVSFVSDITERKRLEGLHAELQYERERLAEARGMERFRLSFEEAPVGMALMDGDGVWLRVNRALCEMTGYTESELVSRGRDITCWDDRAKESLLFSRLQSGQLSAGRIEERYLHKHGYTIYVLLSIAAVERNEAGQPVHFVAHVQDLSDRKRVEQELEASRAQMVGASRLSALGEMAGGIAHEINNPLGVIHASAENMARMAESGSVQIPEILKNCNRISLTADRIAKIVHSLRHIAREGSADEFRKTSVREVVDETLELCAERFRVHNIRLTVPDAIPDVCISCREAQICQVLLNLLQNAFDELVGREKEERWVELDVALRPPSIVFSVCDSGRGIPPENRAHIMEPFFTTKPVGKGTGLGLSISRSIALEHGGALELDPVSVHTCFFLKLPLSDGTQGGHQYGA
jgi:PAS domain S-box-containing protein